MNKKASVRDVILMVVILFMLAIGFLMFHYASNEVVDKMQDTSALSSVGVANKTLDVAKDVSDKFDWIVVVAYIGFILAMVITAFMLETHPIFFTLYVFILIIAVVLAAIMGHMWYQASSVSTFTTTLTKFPMTDFLMGQLPLFTGIAGMIGLIVMYAKSKREVR